MGNVKRALDGTYHAIRKPYAWRYLAAFQYKFNHCDDLRGCFNRAVAICAYAQPITARGIKA